MTRSREPYRSTNAARATEELAAKQLGVKSQRDLDRDRERQGRYTDDAARRAIIIPTWTLQFSRTAQTGTVTTALMRNPLAGSGTGTLFPMPAAGRIIGASIWSSTAWVAGSAAVTVRKTNAGAGAVDSAIPDAIIDGSTRDGHVCSQSAAWITPVKNGIRFAKGDELRLLLVLTSWSGSTDFSADLLVAYDGLS